WVRPPVAADLAAHRALACKPVLPLPGIAQDDAIIPLRIFVASTHADHNVFEIETFLIGMAARACTSWRATDNG
ncbi:hypothetical protein CEJ63_27815, partial [Acinetobacter baumannii]